MPTGSSGSSSSADISAKPEQSVEQPVELPRGFAWLRLKAAHFTGSLDAKEEENFNEISVMKNREAECDQCEKYRDWTLKYSPTVRYMREQIEQIGGRVGRENIICDYCDEYKAGGFNPMVGVLLCQNHVSGKLHLEDTLAHELVHAYDEMKFHVDWMNLKHHACSEIRASNLSGECRMVNEIFRRGQIHLTRQHQECVRRRAVMSVMGNPNCKDEDHAKKVVSQVWDSCFNDTRPFDEIYR
ncbi:mitochondrial inner membrane protease ATP23 [Lipomyces arxii]|uniref:mitochondrial inner membrane protease ATP23 n=1 Tax=Lipomyces arxii TaxID=56418 RepID=UPI0034CEDE35